MAAATLRTKFLLFFSLVLISCGEKITITENDLIEGMGIQHFIRKNQFSGTIIVMYVDDMTKKSKRKYVSGKKNGIHEGWYPDGKKKYSFVFKDDASTGKHFQWHQNGKLFTQKQFKNGLEQGEQKAWDINGDLMYKYIYNNGRKYGIQGSVVCNGGKDLTENND